MSCVLYKRQAAWGLPSLSPGCIQAEALLRFSGADFKVVVHTEPGRSPTGLHPALEKDHALISSAKCCSEFDCVRAMHAALQSTSLDVDAHLTQSQRVMATAMTTLIEQNLEPATLYSAWCENEGFKQYKDAFGGQLPFPLNFIVAKTEQRHVRKMVAKRNPEEIYEKACTALESVSHVLEKTDGYLFGDTPCSTDAFLYGHLIFYRLAPAIIPQLQRKVHELENVKAYVDRISKNYFQEVAPILEAADISSQIEDEEMTSAWKTASQGLFSWNIKNMLEDLKKMDQASKLWLASAAGLLLVYSWFRPPFVIVMDQDGTIAADEDDSE